jgi:hypothetical protein
MPRFDPKDIIYAEVGDKENYAAVLPSNDEADTMTFVGWISKRCYKYGVKVKLTKEELGLSYPIRTAAVKTIVPCKECHEHPCTCPEDKDDDEYIYAQGIAWSNFATPV